MLLQTWGDVLLASFQQLWTGVVAFVPELVVAFIIFIVGWVIAVALEGVVSQVFRAVKVDRALQGLGVEEPLARAGFRLDSGKFVGMLVKWFFILVFLVAAAVLADATRRVVAGSAKAAHLPSAGFLGGVAKWAIWIFAILAAMYQL